MPTPFLKDSTEISFATEAFMEGLYGKTNRTDDYPDPWRLIYEIAFGDGLCAHFRRLGRAEQAARMVS